METLPIIIFGIGMLIIIGGLIRTEIHNHEIELSNERQLKRYRYHQNCEIIPTYWKAYVSTENFTGKTESLDDFAFVFKYTFHGPHGEISKINLQGPKVTSEHDIMIAWFKHIKDTMDREAEPFIINYVD